MDYTTLGRTGLTVSVAGLGCGGFSRLGLSHGKTEAEAADIVRVALDLGVNYIDTAEAYESEGAVGLGIRGRDRSTLVIATKGRVHRQGELYSADKIAHNIDASLKRLRTDYIDVYQPHAPRPENFAHLVEVVLPVLLRAKESGKIRHIGLTESGDDPHHFLLLRATAHTEFEVMLLAFHMMHQNARHELLPRLQANQTGAVGMYAVRNIFANGEVLRAKVRELCAAGQLPAELDHKENPLDFLIHEGGAQTVVDAAYRFVRHQAGVNVVVFGTGNPQHVHSNVTSITRPPLPAEDTENIHMLFGHLVGVGLESTSRAVNRRPMTDCSPMPFDASPNLRRS
ncbi:aldo/keto reductase [Pseudochelatococcus sp. B33]